jgi:hypothetical protein
MCTTRPFGHTRLSQSLIFSRFFDTHTTDRSTNGVGGFLAALEDERIEVSLHVGAKAQAVQTFKQQTPASGDGGNSDKLTPRPDKSLKDKEHKDKER